MSEKQKRTIFEIAASFILLNAVIIFNMNFEVNRYLKAALYMIPFLMSGYKVLAEAGEGILKRELLDENFLMAIATVGAFLLGEYEESVFVMLFYQTGELFESIAVGRSRKNISSLVDIRPDRANLLSGEKVITVSPEAVRTGSIIIVNPGEKIPLDGTVIDGITSVDTSSLTGESLPKDIKVNDKVFSGFINLSGVIRVRTDKEFSESAASKILDTVENAAEKKAAAESFITRFAKLYTPAVCLGAVILAVLPPTVSILTGGLPNLKEWIIRALTFLVISCPCALVISIPLSFFGGIGCASKNGILVKGSIYLERLASVKNFVFDKTGTLTNGVFEVKNIIPRNGFEKDGLIYYAAAAEQASNHPIAKGIKNACRAELSLSDIKYTEEAAGRGIRAEVGGKKVYVGNADFAGCDGSIKEKSGEKTVYVSVDGVYAGCIVLSDTVKKNAAGVIKRLKKAGVKKTAMLSGDAFETANEVGRLLEIDEIKSELLPQDKVYELEKIIGESKSGRGVKDNTAYAGDGINDAPVLARADVGIAMGALGSDAAIEAADVVVMDDNPEKLYTAVRIAEKTMRIVRENIVFAIGVKAICLVLGAVGIGGMWIGIFADVGVMLIAVINSLRTLNVKAI